MTSLHLFKLAVKERQRLAGHRSIKLRSACPLSPGPEWPHPVVAFPVCALGVFGRISTNGATVCSIRKCCSILAPRARP